MHKADLFLLEKVGKGGGRKPPSVIRFPLAPLSLLKGHDRRPKGNKARNMQAHTMCRLW